MIYKLPKQIAVKLSSLSNDQVKISFKTFAMVSVVSFLISVMGLLFIPWQQTAQGTGRVIALSPSDRPQNIDAPIEGRIAKWYVHEGSEVSQNDPILEIVDNDPDILKRLQAERNAVQARLQAARHASKTAKLNVDRQKKLFDQGISSQRTYEQAEIEYARYLTDEANSSAELSRIETRLARQGVQLIRSPRDGTILKRISGQSSELVKVGDTVAVIVPKTQSRAVEIWVDGNDVPLVFAGRKARIQFEGWPAVQFSGWPSIAVGTFLANVAFVDSADNGLGKFRVVLVPDHNEPWPDTRYLRQGVRANAWIQLNRVALGYEFWRRFNGFPLDLNLESKSK